MNLTYDKIVKKKFKGIFDFAVLFFWIGQIYGSVDPLFELGLQNIFLPIQSFFNATSHFGNKFPGFEISLLLLCFIIYSKFPNSYFIRQKKIINLFLLITIIVAILNYLNPNNNYSEGVFNVLASSLGRVFLFYIPFIIIIMYLDNFTYKYVIFRIFKIGFYVTLSKTLFALFAFLIGEGAVFLGRNTTNIQGDFLIWVALYSSISFGIFLYTKNKKYFFVSIIFFICLLFSYRRTSLFLTIITDLSIYISYLIIIKKKYINTLIMFTGICTIIFGIFPYLYSTSKTFFDYTNRYAAVLEITGLVDIQSKEGRYTDTGHFNQSMTTTMFMLDKLDRFWGSGLRVDSREFWVEGRSPGGVHNSIVYLWSRLGMHMVIYYFFLFSVFLYFIFKILFSKTKLKSFSTLFALIIQLFLINRFITSWFSGGTIIDYVQYATQFVLLFSTIKLYYLPDSLNTKPHKV